MTKNKFILILQLVIGLLICTSCWDGVEINRRAVIFSLGIDKNLSQDNMDQIDAPQRYTVSYAIPDMGKVSGDESIAEDIVSVETAKSATFLTSIEQIQTKTQDTINFGHTKAILLGEELLKDADMMKEIIDALERNMLFTRSTLLFAVRDTAEEVMNVRNEQHPIQGLYLMNYVNNKERAVSQYKKALLGNIIRELRENNSAMIPIIDATEESKIQIKGGALLKDFELKAWLTPEEVRGILWTEGKVRGAKLAIPAGTSYLSYTVRQQESHIKFLMEDNKPLCQINITNEGDIGEYYINNTGSLTDLQNIRGIEDKISQKIKKEIEHIIGQTKEYNTDIMGIGRELYIKHPKWWVYMAPEWEEIYRTLPFEINVDTKIRRTGIID